MLQALTIWDKMNVWICQYGKPEGERTATMQTTAELSFTFVVLWYYVFTSVILNHLPHFIIYVRLFTWNKYSITGNKYLLIKLAFCLLWIVFCILSPECEKTVNLIKYSSTNTNTPCFSLFLMVTSWDLPTLDLRHKVHQFIPGTGKDQVITFQPNCAYI